MCLFFKENIKFYYGEYQRKTKLKSVCILFYFEKLYIFKKKS